MYYVAMTDKFMSGWGMSDGKINKLIFECETLEQARTVADNAHNRTDQKYVNIHYHGKPWYSPRTHYVQIKTIESYPTWYKPGAYSK